MNSLRKHLNYANVVATLALLFAMSGGALAASHYLINSTKQINPKVLKRLTGKQGKNGAPGSTGPQGPRGEQGNEGQKGATGTAPETLPSGHSESGDYAYGAGAKTGGFLIEGLTFQMPLTKPVEAVYNAPGTTSTHCSGQGHADQGFLCVYSIFRGEIEESNIAETETGFPAVVGSGRDGFRIDWTATGENPKDEGSYTVTAP